MAVVVFDQTIGQWAGVEVTTTGKSRPNTVAGTTGYAALVSLVDSGGLPTDLALESTLQDVLTALQTPATSLPHFATDTTSDLTHGFSSSSSSGERTLVGAVSGQTTRIYRMTITAAAATVIELRDGASGTALKTMEFPAAGAYVYDFDPRPYVKTTANTALILNSTVATKTTIDFGYITSA